MPGKARHRRVLGQVERPYGLHHQRAGRDGSDHVPSTFDPGTERRSDTPGAPAHLGDIAPLQLRHPAACVVDNLGLDPVLREHALGSAANPGIVVLDEASGVEHGLAPRGRSARIDRRRGLSGPPAEPAGMEAGQHCIAVNTGKRLHERPREPIAAARCPVGERRDGAEQPAVAVGSTQRAFGRTDLAVVQGVRPLTHHQGGKIHRVDVRRRVGTDRKAHVAERAGRAHALEAGARHRVDGVRAVDQIEEPRKTLAEVFAAATGVADASHAPQLAVERARVEVCRRLPVDGGPWSGALLPRHVLPAALSRGRRGWTRQ